MTDAVDQESDREVRRLRQRVARLEGERAEWIRAHNGLPETEEKSGTLVECLGEGVNVVNANQRFLFTNPAAERIFGVEPGGLVGRYLSEFIPLEASKIIQRQAENRRHGKTTTYHLEIIRPNGERRQLLVTGSPNSSADGRCTGAFAVFRDITDRMNMESTLRESLQRLSQVERVAGMGLFDWNIKADEVDLSEGAHRLFQSRPGKLAMTDMVKRLVYPDDLEFVQRALDLAVRGIKPFEIDFRIVSGGKVIWLKSQAEMTRDTSGIPVRLLGTLVDVTDRIRAQHQLKEAFDQMERRVEERTRELRIANDTLAREIEIRKRIEEQALRHREELAHVSRLRTMGEMATGIAHELNQPLFAIANFAYAGRQALQQEDLSNTEQLRDIFQALSEQALRAGDIVRWLRGFVKKTGRQFASSDLNRVVREAASFMGPDLRLNQIRCSVNLVDSVPCVSLDNIQIQQVVVNLIRNAIDAMEETDTEQRELTITTTVSGQMANVAVGDVGKGIPLEAIEEVFHTFYTTKDAGLGMGLSISRSIIEDHGGRLWAEQNANRGVTFRFSIPIKSNYDDTHQQQPDHLRCGRRSRD